MHPPDDLYSNSHNMFRQSDSQVLRIVSMLNIQLVFAHMCIENFSHYRDNQIRDNIFNYHFITISNPWQM
jgi:hypothetical protein